jgi:hypothetical protein
MFDWYNPHDAIWGRLLYGLTCVGIAILFAAQAYVAWLVVRILHRAAYPSASNACPRCGTDQASEGRKIQPPGRWVTAFVTAAAFFATWGSWIAYHLFR